MLCPHPVKGQFIYKGMFQIYPGEYLGDGPYCRDYPITIEICTEVTEPYFRFSTYPHKLPIGQKIIELQHLLSVFSQFYFSNGTISETSLNEFSKIDFENIPLNCISYYQNGLLYSMDVKQVCFPPDLELYFDKYFSIDNKKIKLAFRKAAYLFYLGVEMESQYRSHSFASFVSAIETLVKATYHKSKMCTNPECGQPIYSATRKYCDFIREYTGITNEAYIKKLYNARSKFLHEGLILFSETPWEDERNICDDDDYWLRKNIIGITRASIINWLLRQ